MNLINKSRFQISIIIFLLFFSTISQTNAITSTSDDPQIAFDKIVLEKNPVPNEPFTLTVSINTPSRTSDLFMYLKVPNKISVLSSLVTELDAKRSDQRSATWTLLASEPGSFPIDIVATQNDPPETTIFDFDLSVGTFNSLVVTGIDLPGDIVEKDIFSIGLRIKNTALIDDTNVIIMASIPEGLHLQGPTSMNINKLEPGEEITVNWQVKALKPGSFPIKFFHSSRNAGSNSFDAYVNVGNSVYSDSLQISSVLVEDPPVHAGDIETKLNVELLNTGITTMRDVKTTLKLPNGFTPSWGNSNVVSFGKIDSYEKVTATYYFDIDDVVLANEYPFSILVSEESGEAVIDFDFLVNSKALFEITEVYDDQLYKGSTNVPFKITFQNTSPMIAENVKTKLLGGNTILGVRSSQVTTLGDEVNIGNVHPGQSFTATFLVSVDPNIAVGDLSTSIEISWTRGGDSFIQNVNVPYHLAEGPSYLLYFQGMPFSYVILSGLIFGGVYYFSIQRKRKLKEVEIAEHTKSAI